MTKLSVPLPSAIADELKTAAADQGLAVEQFLAVLLAKHREDAAWAAALADEDTEADLAALKEYERTGEAIPGEVRHRSL